MRSYILKGSQAFIDEYIASFIINHKIPPYSIFRFEEELKIAQVREIKKNISLAPYAGLNRIFIISVEPTVEAQNALLKTIEELPDDATFMFTSTGALLPTILSRSTIVNLKHEKISQKNNGRNNNEEFISEFVHPKSLGSLLIAVESHFANNKVDPIGELIISLRESLLASLASGNNHDALTCQKILTELTQKYTLVSSNNLNPRLVVETIVLNQNSFAS